MFACCVRPRLHVVLWVVRNVICKRDDDDDDGGGGDDARARSFVELESLRSCFFVETALLCSSALSSLIVTPYFFFFSCFLVMK